MGRYRNIEQIDFNRYFELRKMGFSKKNADKITEIERLKRQRKKRPKRVSNSYAFKIPKFRF